jgi:SAM-dependent methyltransferase
MPQVKQWGKQLLLPLLSFKAKQAFDQAAHTALQAPTYLDRAELEKLQQKYPVKISVAEAEATWNINHNTPDTQTAQKLLRLLPDRQHQFLHSLEIGCQHGMVSLALQHKGLRTTGIDIDESEFTAEVRSQGVDLQVMDACKLQFADNSFDLTFSFDAFEHINDPETALREALRVTKPNGLIYLNFKPLYMSPWGLHAWHELGIPYCQMLFSADMLRSVVQSQDLWGCNAIAGTTYRQMWQNLGNQATIVSYRESLNPFHLNLVEQYPHCFRSKTEHFENLVLDGFEVLLQKQEVFLPDLQKPLPQPQDRAIPTTSR